MKTRNSYNKQAIAACIHDAVEDILTLGAGEAFVFAMDNDRPSPELRIKRDFKGCIVATCTLKVERVVPANIS
jgi:hypothetical protein